MRLKKIQINNFRFFNDFELTFGSSESNAGATGIYGRNGTGKTTLLRIIRDLTSVVYAYFDFLNSKVGVDDNQRRMILLFNTGEVYRRLNNNYGDISCILSFENTKAKPLEIKYSEGKIFLNDIVLNHFINPKDSKKQQSFPELVGQLQNILYHPSLAQLQVDFYSERNRRLEEDHSKILESTSFNSTFRCLSDDALLFDSFASNWSSIILTRLHREFVKSKNGEKNTFDQFKNVINSLLTNKELISVDDKVLWFKLHNKDQKLIQIDDLSAGEKNLFTNLLRVYNSQVSNGLILLDEPETSYHFQWSEKLVEALRSIPGCENNQIIFASHSRELAESCDQFIALDIDPEEYSLVVTDSLNAQQDRK